nr:hypothetical protein [Escherichia coli]
MRRCGSWRGRNRGRRWLRWRPGWKNMRNTGVLHDHNAKKRLTLQPPTQPLVVDRAGMLGNGVTERSHQLWHCQTERTGDCRLQHETDRGCVFLTAPVRNNCQKHSQKPFQRVLTRHWKPACRHGSRNTTRSFWCRLPWYRGHRISPGKSSRILPGE